MSDDRFKFRVWDKAENKYNGFSFHLAMSGELDRLSGDGDLLETDEDRFIIEQCTGLKDKNGKLIYEGDVFEATVLNSFDGDSMVGNRIRGQVAYYIDETCFAFAAYSPFNLGQIEIIGNIHEMELGK